MKTVGIPLILTFKLDPVSQGRLDRWREEHFPKERNHLKAHLSIYHQLPGQQLATIRTGLEEFAATQTKLPVSFTQLMTRQGFVGIAVESEAMQTCKAALDTLLQTLLRAQDRKTYRPHITVSNLGSPRAAAQTFAAMEKVFAPWTGDILGLELYHYRHGPWELASIFPFSVP